VNNTELQSEVIDKIHADVYDMLCIQIQYQLYCQTFDQVEMRLRHQIMIRIWDLVWDQTSNIIGISPMMNYE
jgi:hypothetical protein